MSVVENAPADCQQITEQLAVQRIRFVAKPFGERGVDTDDASVRISDDMTTRSVLPEFLDAVLGHVDRAKAAIADAVASGALTCGQCPVASNVTI